MGLGPRRVVDNQGKVRSGSAYFPFTVPLAAGTQPRRHGLPARRFVPEKTICADVGLHGMDIHLGEVYAQAPRSDPESAKALRCGQSPSRTAYLSRCPAWRYRHAPGRSVHARQPGKRFTHKPGRDSAKRAVADPGLRRYRPGAALAFGSQGVPSYLAAVLLRPGYARLKPVENPRDRRVDKPAEALCITPHVDNGPFHPQLKNAYQQGPDRVWDSLIIRYRLCLYWARSTYQQKSRCQVINTSSKKI